MPFPGFVQITHLFDLPVFNKTWTISGPAVSGFKDINDLPIAKLEIQASKNEIEGKSFVKIKVNNTSNFLVFFTQLKLQNTSGENIAPAFYSDNFFNLLPGESKEVTIEVRTNSAEKFKLITDAFNTKQQVINL